MKTIGLIISIAAIAYCVAFFGFGIRLDYKIRMALCMGDKACEYEINIALCEGDKMCEAKVWWDDKWEKITN